MHTHAHIYIYTYIHTHTHTHTCAEEFVRAFKILSESGDMVKVMEPYEVDREGAAPFPANSKYLRIR
jgi:hypothetical protein